MGVMTDAILFYGYCWDDEDNTKLLDIIDATSCVDRTSPCLIDTHCSASCPMGYVAVKKSITVSHRGYPNKIHALTTDPVWDADLAEYCASLGIKIGKKKPAWWLVSDWSE